jgi:ATP-dependent protease ClpP protease subunit
MKKNKDNANPEQFFKIVALEGKESADMLLYGYIGQKASWWDEGDPEEDLTDMAFTKEFRRLEKQYKRINLRINSSGGSVKDGDAIISAIQASGSEVHVYNDGTAASMAADIWLSVTDKSRRHMSPNAKLMIHSTMTMAFGNAKAMRETAEMLDKFDEAAVGSLAKALGKDEADVLAEYYDGKDHWLTAKDALALGLIESIESASEAAEEKAGQPIGQMRLFEEMEARLAALEAEAAQAEKTIALPEAASAAQPEALPEEPETVVPEDEMWRLGLVKKRLMLAGV